MVEYADESIIQGLQQWPGFRLSPDGQSIACTGRTFENHVPGTVVGVHLLGGGSWEFARATEPERVQFQDWTPDGRGLLLIRRNTKERRNMLYEARLEGAPLRPLGVSMYGMSDVDLRPDGRAITYTAGMRTVEVWVLKGFLPPAEGR